MKQNGRNITDWRPMRNAGNCEDFRTPRDLPSNKICHQFAKLDLGSNKICPMFAKIIDFGSPNPSDPVFSDFLMTLQNMICPKFAKIAKFGREVYQILRSMADLIWGRIPGSSKVFVSRPRANFFARVLKVRYIKSTWMKTAIPRKNI